jgi:mono/diheme cytochrome c family protein
MFNSTVNVDGVELVVSNCLTCHASEFNGELVIGLGNPFLDFTEDPAITAEMLGAFVDDGPAAAAWAKWADRIGAIAPYMITDTIGVNPAPNLTMALIAHRDPRTLAWHDEPRLQLPPREPLPTKVPPWWRMQHKAAMFHHGGGRGDHVRFMMMKSLVCTDDLPEAREIDRWFADVRAYIASLESPEYPYPIDTALADEGEEIFERACSGCHGTYGEGRDYPNLVIALEAVGTDPAYARQAVEAERFIRWFNQSFYGQGAEARPAPGYVAPPLDGVWATAPYLHNASVPTIAALLDSSTRPTYWRLRPDPREYDQTPGVAVRPTGAWQGWCAERPGGEADLRHHPPRLSQPGAYLRRQPECAGAARPDRIPEAALKQGDTVATPWVKQSSHSLTLSAGTSGIRASRHAG